MPWVYQPHRRPPRRSRRRTYANGYDDNPYADDYGEMDDDYGDDYDGGDDYYQRRTRRRRSSSRNSDDFDGALFDREGNQVDLVIQTPRDMLPPQGNAIERPGDWNIIRSRARF